MHLKRHKERLVKNMPEAAIGVFDSGLGGLTCVKQLISLMPYENIIYFGDTARVPYGNRSSKTIHRYATQAIEFLLKQDVKLLINACGSMSSSIDKEYTKTLPVKYIDCIIPAAAAAVDTTKNKRIGVIATAATTRSQSFVNAINELDSSITTISKACPLFVPLVENGYVSADNEVTTLVARDYLEEFLKEDIDTLVLGCTHYPIIAELISTIVGNGISLIDSGAEAAKQATQYLNFEPESREKGRLKIYVSDNPIGFTEVASSFLGFVPRDIWLIDIETIESNKGDISWEVNT